MNVILLTTCQTPFLEKCDFFFFLALLELWDTALTLFNFIGSFSPHVFFVFFLNWHLKRIFLSFCNIRPEKWHSVCLRWVFLFLFFSFLMVSSLPRYIVAWCTRWPPGPHLACSRFSPSLFSLCVWGSVGWAGGKVWGAWSPPFQGSPFHCCSYCAAEE